MENYPPPGPDPRTMSREQLAEKLRPGRLVGGYEYRLDEPDFETADLILGTEDVPNTPESLGTKSAFARPKYIIGPDDRRRVDNPRFFPGSANAHIATQNCTATMIGPSTALCAAHCFFNDGWIPSRSITFGADTNAPTAPFGSFLADSLTLPGAWNHPATGTGISQFWSSARQGPASETKLAGSEPARTSTVGKPVSAIQPTNPFRRNGSRAEHSPLRSEGAISTTLTSFPGTAVPGYTTTTTIAATQSSRRSGSTPQPPQLGFGTKVGDGIRPPITSSTRTETGPARSATRGSRLGSEHARTLNCDDSVGEFRRR